LLLQLGQGRAFVSTLRDNIHDQPHRARKHSIVLQGAVRGI
jgi:hypothetical protein